MRKLPIDSKEFLQLLNSHKVKYLLVGGWSVALHAKPRYTKDIDILLERSKENAEKILSVLNEFGFGSLGITLEDFLSESQIIQLGKEPGRIDLLTSIPAVDFASAWQKKVQMQLDDVLVNVISCEDLIKNKKAAGRPQDLADVASLIKTRK